MANEESPKVSAPEPEAPEFTRPKYDYLIGWLGKLNDMDAAEIYPILYTMRMAHRG